MEISSVPYREINDFPYVTFLFFVYFQQSRRIHALSNPLSGLGSVP